MIVCSCTYITSDDIYRTVQWMKSADPDVVITAGKVYRALGKRPVCGGCAKLFIDRIHQPVETDLPVELLGLRSAATTNRLGQVAARNEPIAVAK